MNPDFLTQIEHPHSRHIEALRDKAIQNVKEDLPNRSVDVHDERVFQKLAFTYYHDWTADDPDFMMMSEDPGPIGSRHTSDLLEFAELPEGEPLAQVGLYRNFASRWLAEDNYRFSETFFGACADQDLIEMPDSVREYIRSEAMYDDFYVTDANKYRATASAARTRAALSTAFTTRELAEIDPEVVFAFGNDAWELLAEELALSSVDGTHPPDAGITDIDGHLYESQRLIDTYVIPLLHMSGQAFGAQRTPTEYRECLEDGLQTWNSVR